MSIRSLSGRLLDPLVLVECFIAANLAFLAVDIYVAHSMNGFAHRAEWIPFGFSLVSPLLFVLSWLMAGSVRPLAVNRGALAARTRAAVVLGMSVGAGSIAVGITGFVLHLESHFFQQQTLRNLVYAAPFVAPLAYSGIGLLVLLDRMVPSDSDEWPRWIVLLGLGGWIGNFVLSLTDHAQNAFFYWAEWIPVFASAVAIGALTVAIADYRNRSYLRLCVGLMGIEMAVGVAGWVLHLIAIAKSPMEAMWDRIVYSAPVFAPLLFANLALLALIGLVTLLGQTRAESPVSAPTAIQSVGD